MTTVVKLINWDDLAIKAHELVNNEIRNGGDYETYCLVIYNNLIWELWSAIEIPQEKAFYVGKILRMFYVNAVENSRSIELRVIHNLVEMWNCKLSSEFPELMNFYDLERTVYKQI